jgi:hypothetical protein
MCPDDGQPEDPQDPQLDTNGAELTDNHRDQPASSSDGDGRPEPAVERSATVEEAVIPPPGSVPLPQAVRAPKIVPSAKVSDVSPDHGPTIGGTRVNLDGENLYRESIVRLDDQLATTIGAVDGRQLSVTAPPHKAAGPVDISIQNPGSEVTVMAKAFRYEPLPAPKIDTVAPNRGAVGGGTELSVTGKNFVAATVVLLDGIEVDRIVLIDATALELKTPPGKTGQMVDIVVKNPDGKSDVARRAFAYDERY